MTDPLTGISTPRDARLLGAGSASEMRRQLAVLLFDVDPFKADHDGFGHQTATKCSRARCARPAQLRAMTCRPIGGEEFVCTYAGWGEGARGHRRAPVPRDRGRQP